MHLYSGLCTCHFLMTPDYWSYPFGWQGTVKEITIKTLKRIREQEHIKPETLHVHLGPALSQEKFEVDRDVYEKYQKLGYADPFMYYQTTTGKYHIDNQQTVKKQCELIGVPAAQITYDPICTFKSPLHFSYREDEQAGRHHLHLFLK